MTMLLRCIRAENRKLRRSPIWLLFLAVPAISAVYGTFNYRMNLEILTHGWYDLWTQYTLFYAIFFFAPLIGVYAAYLWRLEHRGHNWNLIMTAPVRPFCLYFAKLGCWCCLSSVENAEQHFPDSHRRRLSSGCCEASSVDLLSLRCSFCCQW